MAQELGLPVGVRGALDGSSVAALASRHKLVNQKTLRGRMAELNRAIETDQQDHAGGRKGDITDCLASSAAGRDCGG